MHGTGGGGNQSEGGVLAWVCALPAGFVRCLFVGKCGFG